MFPVLVATIAPILSGVQTVPQLHKTYTTKSVKDLSLVFILLVLFADFLWLVHGHYITDNSLIFAGAFGLFVNGILLFLFFRYSKKNIFGYKKGLFLTYTK